MTQREPAPHDAIVERTVAERLRELGVTGILITAAEEGYVTEVACDMPTCYCPEELGGKTYFEPVPEPLSDWMPTQDHIELKSEGGKLTVHNVRLAHRLCNRVHFNEAAGKSIKRDLARVEAARSGALIPPRFRIMRGEEEINTATGYEQALELAGERADRIIDTATGAIISLRKGDG